MAVTNNPPFLTLSKNENPHRLLLGVIDDFQIRLTELIGEIDPNVESGDIREHELQVDSVLEGLRAALFTHAYMSNKLEWTER